MSEPAITVSHLSKRYQLGMITRKTLQDECLYWYHKLRGRNAGDYMGKVNTAQPGQPAASGIHPANEFWALSDVSFEMQPGEILGIVGGNGAGKSTLLKILSQITEPTRGEAVINGRVGSLLEVGTGFHPELTGRENIYMSGTILGMKKAEIDRKFDEIVTFSEVEQFLDTPVKRYSSGMFVRLAFAVAAHLEPEILVVDEVLAVGDASFQKKCLGKMGDVARNGRTILFVSHNMAAVENLCTRALWLDHGRVRMIGETAEVVEDYLNVTQDTAMTVSLRNRTDRRGSGRAKLVDFRVTDESGKRQNVLRPGNNYRFHLDCELNPALTSLPDVVASIHLMDHRNETVWMVNSSFTHENQSLAPGITTLECTVRDFNVAEGSYNVLLYLGYGNAEILDLVSHAADLSVEGGDFFGTGSKGDPARCRILTRATWQSQHSL